MKLRTMLLAALAGFGLGMPTSEAEPSAAEQCLLQCKENVESCIKAAGDDADQIQQCSAQAMQCIESCKG